MADLTGLVDGSPEEIAAKVMEESEAMRLRKLEEWREGERAAQERAQPPAAPRQPQSTATANVSAAAGSTLAWPPGRVGVIARHLYATSYSPIAEVAITATLGLLAGVCGRAYRTHTDKDLALYMILVAKSGVGKDAMHDGIPLMLKAADVPFADKFCRAQDFASGEALHKEVLREPGFLYLQGEFGRKLKRMSDPKDSPMQTFRTVMTNAFSKRYLEGKAYSNKPDSVEGVAWPALSFVGETTPGTFLECLTEDMMADGFMSRFLVISYTGDRPPPNRNRKAELPANELAYWRNLVDHAVRYQMTLFMPDAIPVGPNGEAIAMLDAFELACIEQVNSTDDETERAVWNRAHLKAMKVACLLAVADNYLFPVVCPEHVEWALGLVRRDIEMFQTRKRNGDIGTGDDARERKLVAFIKDYIVKPVISASYKVPEKMHQHGIIPRTYLQMRTGSLPAFRNHKLGPSKALDEAIGNLVKNGCVMEVKHEKVVGGYGHHGKAYRVLELPH